MFLLLKKKKHYNISFSYYSVKKDFVLDSYQS